MSNQESTKARGSSPVITEARGRSTIEFPYLDFDSAVEVATAVHTVGGTSCEWNQLAAQMKQAPSGGGFRMRLMTARSFGLLNYDRGIVELTDLGIRVLDPKHSKPARAESFLVVPLFKAMFDQLNGKVLPPAAAIERMIESCGVAPKQKDKARQVFIRSAKQAGYFELDQDRLVSPPIANKHGAATNKDNDTHLPKEKNAGEGGGTGGGENMHPFIKGLLQKLPPPETAWSIDGRAKWLSTAANIFDLIYTSEEAKIISVKVDSL
jgi:hypothetical protein